MERAFEVLSLHGFGAQVKKHETERQKDRQKEERDRPVRKRRGNERGDSAEPN